MEQTTKIVDIAPTQGSADGGTIANITLDAPVPNTNVSGCRIATADIYGLPPKSGTIVSVEGKIVRCTLPSIQTVGSVYLQVETQGVWVQSNSTFSYVQPLDVSLGRSLYNTGGPAATEKGGFADPDTQGELLARLSPTTGGFDGPATLDLVDDATSVTLASLTGVPTDGSTKVSVPFDLSKLACMAENPPAASTEQLTDADVRAGLVCNASLTVHASWETGATLTRQLRLLAGPWGPTSAAMDFRSGALIVENGRKFISTGYMFSLHSNTSATYAPTALRVQARHGDTIAMPYAVDMGSHELLAPALERLGNETYNNGMRFVADLADTFFTILQGNASSSWAMVEDAVRKLKDHPALLGWYVNDDVIGRQQSLCRRLYLLVRSIDPWHPTFAAVAGSGNAWQYHSDAVDVEGGAAGMTYDVGSYEMYIENDPAFEIATISVAWPLCWTPQWITGFGDGNALAVEGVNRVQGFFTAMYHGKGSLMWDYWPFSEAAWPYAVQSSRWGNAAMGEFGQQMLSSLLDPRVDVTVDSSSGALVAVELTDDLYCTLLLIGNTGRVPASFGLVSPAGARLAAQSGTDEVHVPVLFERRHAVLHDGGMLNETLDGFGTRAIRINCSLEGGGGGPGKGYGDDDYSKDDFATDDGGGPSSSNRLYNPSFEDFETPLQPAGYYMSRICSDLYPCGDGNGVTQEPHMHRIVDPMVARSGGHSLRVSGHVEWESVDPKTGQPGQIVELMNIFDSNDKNPGGRPFGSGNGTVFDVSIWVRPGIRAEGWPAMHVMFIGPNAFEPCDFPTADMTPFTWNQVNCTRVANSTPTTPALAFQGAGTVWLDDVSIELS
jgi:hypothetical protein